MKQCTYGSCNRDKKHFISGSIIQEKTKVKFSKLREGDTELNDNRGAWINGIRESDTCREILYADPATYTFIKSMKISLKQHRGPDKQRE